MGYLILLTPTIDQIQFIDSRERQADTEERRSKQETPGRKKATSLHYNVIPLLSDVVWTLSIVVVNRVLHEALRP